MNTLSVKLLILVSNEALALKKLLLSKAILALFVIILVSNEALSVK